MSLRSGRRNYQVEDVTTSLVTGPLMKAAMNGHTGGIIEVTELNRDTRSYVGRGFMVSDHAMSTAVSDTEDLKNFCTACLAGLEGFTIEGVRLWLRIIHNTVTNDQTRLAIEDVWNALAFGIKYNLPLEKLKAWYDLWIGGNSHDRQNLGLEDLKMHLLPSYLFRHASHFAYVTMRLSYLATSFMEVINPTEYENDKLLVPSRILDQINAAKSSMRIEIDRKLLDIANPEGFCPRPCSKQNECHNQYMRGVAGTKLFPFSTRHQVSIQAILDSLKDWTPRKVPGSSCMPCTIKLRGDHVEKVRDEVQAYWAGMCFNCMELSSERGAKNYAAYFSKDDYKEWGDYYGADCKPRHKRNSWYHSFMGPNEVMVSYRKKKDEQR